MGGKSVPAIDIPKSLMSGSSISGAYARLVRVALKKKLEPVKMNIKGVERRTISLSPLMENQIAVMAEEHEMKFSAMFAGLVQAGINLLVQENSLYVSQPVALPPFKNPRPEQNTYYQAVKRALDNGKVCMAEASTGVGKTRVILAAAIETAQQEEKTPVVITAPTLAILGHIWGEFETLRKEKIGNQLKAIFFPAKSEFINKNALIGYLNEVAELPEEQRDDNVWDWVKNGAPPKHRSKLVQAMEESGTPLSWLMEDLRELAKNLPPQDFALNGDEEQDDEGLLILKEVRESAQDADIIFCTHAMLGYAQQSRWKMFPQPRCIIVDEAHLFEANFANIHTSRVSLFSLRRSILKAQGTTKKAQQFNKKIAKQVSRLVKKVKGLDVSGSSVRLSSGDYPELLEMTQSLAENLKFKGFAESPHIREAKHALKIFNGVLSGEVKDRADLEFSPDRRFPSFMAGAHSVGKHLGGLWKGADGGVILASATLFIKDQFGNTKCDYLARNLAVPHARLDAPTPVIAPWTINNVTLHIPRKEICPDLARPNGEERKTEPQKELDWLVRVGNQSGEILKQARGGTLLLATSYKHLDKIAEQLIEIGLDKNRVVAQQRNVKFAQTEEEFREKHAAGFKPVLLGLGAAWTGIDLKDKSVPATQDTLATDLIISCLPLGLNRTSTMMSRIDRMKMDPINKEALMMLRQGLGRLVRGQQMTGRNIWLLDGRIWLPWKGMKSFKMAVQRTLGVYQDQVEF